MFAFLFNPQNWKCFAIFILKEKLERLLVELFHAPNLQNEVNNRLDCGSEAQKEKKDCH